jgi:hypothetical protein
MRRKRLKQREKLGNFEQWEINFMKNGPPPYSEQMVSPHRFAYLDGYHIWRKLKLEPGFDPKDFPWALKAYRNKEKPQSEERG